MAEFAALPLFTDSYMRDCWHLTDAEHGRYFLLLMLLWQSPQCRIPNDPEWIARKMRRTPEDFNSSIVPLIKEFCVSDGNWITQKRLAKEFAYVRKNRKKKSDAAKTRWDKDKNYTDAYAEVMQTPSRNAAPSNAPTPTPSPSQKDTESTVPTYPNDQTPSVLRQSSPDGDLPAPNGHLVETGEQAAIRLWVAMAEDVGLPKPEHMHDARMRKLKLRLREVGGLQGWETLLEKIRGSPHLRGDDGKWRVSFDWVLEPKNLTKIMEGNYDDKPRKPRQGVSDEFAEKLAAAIDRSRDKHHRG